MSKIESSLSCLIFSDPMIREDDFEFDRPKIVTDIMEQSNNETRGRAKYSNEDPSFSRKRPIHYVASKRRKSARKEIVLEGEHAYAR